jgi:predicted MFS family arabinose efflux permease
MICRSCGATIAEKAIICYRCGAPTAAEPVRPARLARRRPITLTVVLLVASLLLAALAASLPAESTGRWMSGAAAAVLVVAALGVWLLRGRSSVG